MGAAEGIAGLGAQDDDLDAQLATEFALKLLSRCTRRLQISDQGLRGWNRWLSPRLLSRSLRLGLGVIKEVLVPIERDIRSVKSLRLHYIEADRQRTL